MKYWNEFRGIKYGRKPIRFEKPIPKATNNNPQDATKYGSQCVQERFKASMAFVFNFPRLNRKSAGPLVTRVHIMSEMKIAFI